MGWTLEELHRQLVPFLEWVTGIHMCLVTVGHLCNLQFQPRCQCLGLGPSDPERQTLKESKPKSQVLTLVIKVLTLVTHGKIVIDTGVGIVSGAKVCGPQCLPQSLLLSYGRGRVTVPRGTRKLWRPE